MIEIVSEKNIKIDVYLFLKYRIMVISNEEIDYENVK